MRAIEGSERGRSILSIGNSTVVASHFGGMKAPIIADDGGGVEDGRTAAAATLTSPTTTTRLLAKLEAKIKAQEKQENLLTKRLRLVKENAATATKRVLQ